MDPGPTPTPPSNPPVLDCENIQGDIISGLPRKVKEHVFFQITNAEFFKKQLTKVIPFITTMAQVKDARDAISEHKMLNKEGLVKVPGVNVSFSQFGLNKLSITEDLGDDIFKAGQQKDSEVLGDPGQGQGDSFVPDWDPKFKQPLDGMFIFTAESEETLAPRREEVLGLLNGSYRIVTSLFCKVRPGREGREHFDFEDGISQPGISGFTVLLPGQRAVDPGIILLGNGVDERTSKFAKDGSFLAFRKLNQLVPEFDQFLLDNGAGLNGKPDQEGADLLGARFFGRWKSGAPIDLAPEKDDPDLGADPQCNNKFDFGQNPNDQTRCPFAAHIRKTYPRRDLVNPAPNRIIRHGCPYGPEVSEKEKQEKRTIDERGLAFGCYQSKLDKGFNFVQRAWSNNTRFPPGKTHPDGSKFNAGFDPIIGQAGDQERWMAGYDPKVQYRTLPLPFKFVVTRGGEYFFVPSIIALKEVIAAQDA